MTLGISEVLKMFPLMFFFRGKKNHGKFRGQQPKITVVPLAFDGKKDLLLSTFWVVHFDHPRYSALNIVAVNYCVFFFAKIGRAE